MDQSDSDFQMLDEPQESISRENHSSALENSTSNVHLTKVHTSISAGSSVPNFTNGFADTLYNATPSSDHAGQVSSIGLVDRDGSPDISVIANNFAGDLDDDHEHFGTRKELSQYLDDLKGDEQDAVAPFRSSLPSGYCYDVRMRYHYELEPPRDRRDYHPEDPRRIFAIYRELCFAGLIRDSVLNNGSVIPNPMRHIEARAVTEAEVTLVHHKKHFDTMKATSSLTPDELIIVGSNYDSIYLNGVTFQCALLSAGGAIETCRAVCCGMVKNAIAVIRPPGHHAECSRPMGFCIFDNVSIATKVCQSDFPEAVRRVLILDWDVHHGIQSIHKAFYQDPNVLYISLHVHEDGKFYPPGPYGDHFHCGAGDGQGRNINIPWPTKGMGDAEYMFAFQNVVMPVADEFNPDLVIIAAGFDAAAGDPLGGCFVTPACYAHMTHMLMRLAGGKLVVCLEGGYDLRSISKSALAVTRTLIGEIPDRLSDPNPKVEGVETVQKVKLYQSKWWPCLYPKTVDENISSKTGAERMHDVIRSYQALQLKEKHNMINVVIYRDKLSKSFEHQVVATPNFEDAVPLIMFLHDPPEIIGAPDPVSKGLELHNTWLTDGLKDYVDWAIKRGFAVIDVNVPRHITGYEETSEDMDAESDRRLAATKDVAEYLWDNYIDCNDASPIFVIGVGTPYQGIMSLLNHRESFYRRVTGMINFIADSPGSPLIPASDQTIYHLSKWYRSNSQNYVSKEHFVWSLPKRPSKRYGNLIESSQTGLSDMLREHKEEVQEWIALKAGL